MTNSRYAFFVEKNTSMRIKNLLPDKRLKDRGALLMSRMVEKRSCIVRQISMNWKEEMGFGRYLSHTRVSLDWLIESSLESIKTADNGI
jgi:hypothetical protein